MLQTFFAQFWILFAHLFLKFFEHTLLHTMNTFLHLWSFEIQKELFHRCWNKLQTCLVCNEFMRRIFSCEETSQSFYKTGEKASSPKNNILTGTRKQQIVNIFVNLHWLYLFIHSYSLRYCKYCFIPCSFILSQSLHVSCNQLGNNCT